MQWFHGDHTMLEMIEKKRCLCKEIKDHHLSSTNPEAQTDNMFTQIKIVPTINRVSQEHTGISTPHQKSLASEFIEHIRPINTYERKHIWQIGLCTHRI